MTVLMAAIISASIPAFAADAVESPPAQAAAVTAFTGPSDAAEDRTSDSAAGSEPRTSVASRDDLRTGAQENYVGVVTAPVPAAVASQLAGLLKKGRGLLVTQVLVDSPARRAGLREYDILTTYNGQPLSSSNEFKQLIVADKAGRSVDFGVIRGGRLQEVVVTLGRRSVVTQTRGGENGLPQLFQRSAAPKLDHANGPAPSESDSPAVAEQPSRDSRNVTVVITQQDAAEMTVNIHLVDAQRRSKRWRFNGTKEKVLAQLDELPTAVHETVRSSLDQTMSLDDRNRALRLQFQPRLEGENRSYRILFCRPAPGGGTRVLGLEQSVGADDRQVLDELLENRELNRELDSLSPQVRSKLQGALKTLPAIEPPADTSASQ